MIAQTTQTNWYDYLKEVLDHITTSKDTYWVKESEKRLVESLYYYIDQSLSSSGLYMDGSVDMLCIFDKIWDSYISKYNFLIAFRKFKMDIVFGLFKCSDSHIEYQRGFFDTLDMARKYFNEPIVKEIIRYYQCLV